MIPLGPVVARSRVGVARAAAWTYLVEPDRRAEWWPELQLDARVGGVVAEQWSEGEGDATVSRDASGTVDVWVEGHAVGFTWREAGDERDTAVLITLRTQGVDTGITVTETGFDALPSAGERAAASQEGWQVLLRDLKSALEAAQAAGAFGDREQPDAGAGSAVAAGSAAAGSAAAAGAETGSDASDASAGAGGELEVLEPEVDGEIDDTVAASGSADDAPAIEIDAEPAVGDHPELETNPVTVISGDEADAPRGADGADAESERGHDLDETIQIDRSELPTAQSPESRRESDAGRRETEAPSDPEEPDFDTLIRGE
ncbi:SRPBCC family protein [Leucobacter chromiiresistens]